MGGVSTFLSFLWIIGQLLTLKTLKNFLGVPEWVVIPAIGVVVVGYMWMGGVRTVTATDVLQFVVVGIGFAVIVHHVFKKQNSKS